jgi:hypothetical protein
MPKLRRSRIINLNYNDGKRTIYNEAFDYGEGKDTLFSMENGIGKTVLIQFFLQPFIRNKRELAGRKFEDYFTGSAPTYIMHEVLLDNGEKLLVGMVIKKDISEDEKSKLRIITFLNKYIKPNDFDIINIPFVEGKRILKFSEAEDKIKKYKIGKLNFKYYNFNDSSKKNEYFEDLKAYKINYKEWEDIIRLINNDESGLSNLYDKHKTDEALIRNIIVPLIESKINGEKSTIEAIRNNLSKYIESFKESKEAFQEVDLLKAFSEEMTPVIEILKEGLLKEDNRDSLYKKLSYIAILCEEEFAKKCNEKRQCEDFIEELSNELNRLYYEEHSLKYYNFQSEESKVEEKLEELSESLKGKELTHKELVRDRYIQESAEIYEDILITEAQLAEVLERISNHEKADSEIAQNIKNYKFTLKGIYEQELKELQGKEQELLNYNEALAKNIEENEREQKTVSIEQKENIRAEEASKNKIACFEKIEQEFKKRYKAFNLQRNPLLNEYSEKELGEYNLNIDKSTALNMKQQETLNNEISSLLVEKKKLGDNIEEANKELRLNREALITRENDLKNYNKDTSKILELLSIYNLPLKPASHKERLKELLYSELIKLQDTLNKEQSKLREEKDTIHRYETGLIQLPKEVMESFENKGISFEYALSFMQNYKGSKEEKESLIKNNPFFPYGILLSAKDINVLKKESIEVYTSIPIPIINKSNLNKSLKAVKNCDILTVENAEFLEAFNYLLIDEEERLALLRGLAQEINELSLELSNVQNAIDRNKGYAAILANYKHIGNENEVIEAEVNELQAVINELEEKLDNYKVSDLKKDERREANIRKLNELDKQLITLKEQKVKFEEFTFEHEEFKKYNGKLSNVKKLNKELEKREKDLKDEYTKLQSLLRDAAVNLKELRNSIKETAQELEQYKNVQTGVVIKDDKHIIKASLKSCENKLGDNIKRDKEQESSLNKGLKKFQDRLNRTVKDGNLAQEYKKVSFNEEKLEELKREIAFYEDQLNNIKADINSLDKKIALIIEKKQREQQDIEKLGFPEPISKEAIKDLNFRVREKKIKQDLKENEAIIKAYMEEIDKLKLLRQSLNEYKSYSKDVVDLAFDFSNLASANKIIDEYLSFYDNLKKEIYNIEAKITREIGKIHEKYRDKNRLIKERLFDYLNKERKVASSSDIESLLEIVDRKISYLESQLSYIKAEEEIVLNDVQRYTTHILEELRTIDKKSTIKHLGKTQKLLEINIPEDKEEQSLKEYIKEKVNYYGSFEGDYTNLLESDIQSSELLSKLVGNINRIRVDIKKIEKTGLIRKNWKDALSQNSGGEKFVSMFILLSSLMSYMRKSAADIDNKEEKKILIMDNPFAKTNAEHLLEPMFQIAERYNIQLLCFSGIGGSAVYNRFDKIYAAKVVVDKFRNKENVSFKADSEETLELTDFTITKEQISMF